MWVFVVIGLLLPIQGVEPQKQDPARRLAEAKFNALVEELKAVPASNPALQQELLKMREEDQLLRAEGQKLWETKGLDSPEAKAVWERQGVLDQKNQARLKEIVAAYGWPGVKLVGLSGADAAFLIAQHADLAAQKTYLPMLKTAVKQRDALPLWPAMLEDRVLVGDGKPQIFGTQLLMSPGSTKWQLRPIQDEAGVDTRRAEVGLGPLAEYLKDFGIDYKPVAPEQAPAVDEVVNVSATRTAARLEDVPTRVEVLNREEIEEKLLMTPGDIVMMLNEMGGMRVQTTSPGLGAATVRVQGMRGRYTRFFSDGLPLFGEVGGIGLLQIPPMDLGQVEVIKGVASSLYGAGAMGGVVNLVSRQPGAETERELLVNQSTRGATDVVGWYASPAKTGWAFTFLGGGHRQSPNDVNADSWSDLAGYSRAVVRPRLFWSNGKGNTFFTTVGVTAENRSGGTAGGQVLPTSGEPYVESLETRRIDGGFVGQVLFGKQYLFSARAALSDQHHVHQFGEITERDRHGTAFAEITLRRMFGRHTVVFGSAVEHDSYRPQDVPQFAFRYWVPGAFAQADLELKRWLSISGSARVDHHNQYGTFLSPRIAALFRSGQWSSRMSVGTGFFGPSPLTEETEASGLTRLVIPESLRAERGQSASVDLTRKHGGLSYTVTLFGSRVEHPISVDRSSGLVLTNLPDPTTNIGMEFLGTFRRAPYAVTATYSFVQSREVIHGVARDVALTPRHNVGIVGMWEREDRGRFGVECYFTGAQRLDENPYRETSKPYVIVGLLAERQLGRYRLFINGENLTGVRQTRWDPLIRPTRAADGRWTVDAWAPLEGRNINGGIRLRF